MHDPSLDGTGIDVVMRDSQCKFKWNEVTIKSGEKGANGEVGRSLGSCTRGESRPFNYGRLNKQYVLVLKALGISEKTFLDVQAPDSNSHIIRSGKVWFYMAQDSKSFVCIHQSIQMVRTKDFERWYHNYDTYSSKTDFAHVILYRI